MGACCEICLTKKCFARFSHSSYRKNNQLKIFSLLHQVFEVQSMYLLVVRACQSFGFQSGATICFQGERYCFLERRDAQEKKLNLGYINCKRDKKNTHIYIFFMHI